MRNTHYIDPTRPSPNPLILGRICHALIKLKNIESVLDKEIDTNQKLIQEFLNRGSYAT
jgi:hypothetical protein